MTTDIIYCIAKIINISLLGDILMSEENKTSNDNEQPAGREGQNQPAILINTQYIKDLSLEIPHAPEIFKEIKSAPEVQINVEVGYQTLENNFYNVELKLNMDGDVNHQKLFILELTYSAVVALNVPAEHLEPVLMIEIPRLIFPFARNVVTNCLVEGGLPPFMINPIDFVTMYNNRKAGK